MLLFFPFRCVPDPVHRFLRKAAGESPQPEWECYALNERINDIGVCADRGFVRSAIACDRQYRRNYLDLLYTLTGMEYASAENLREWLKTQGILVRTCASFGLPPQFLRLAVKTERENTVLINALREGMAKRNAR